MGASYVRDEPLPALVEVIQGTTRSLEVAQIYDEYTFGKVPLLTNLRQASSSALSFVIFSEEDHLSTIHIDATNVKPGDYDLQFESFDSASPI